MPSGGFPDTAFSLLPRGCINKLGYVGETYGDPRHAVYARSYFALPEFVLTARRKLRLVEKRKLVQKSKAQ